MLDWKEEIRRRLATLMLEPTRETAIVEELDQHLDDCYTELLANGVTSGEAARRTLAELDETALLPSALKRMRWEMSSEPIVLGTNRRKNVISDMFQDIRYGARVMGRHPGFTLIAVLSLALGIGANTAIFSLLDALLLKPLPVAQPEQLVVVGTDAPDRTGPAMSSFSYPVFRELRGQNTVFSGMFAHTLLNLSMSGGGQTERVLGELVSGSFFSVVGVNAHLGRVFTQADDRTPGAHPVVVMSYNLWKRRFGADPQIVGQTISLNGYPFTVIGVAASDFQGVEVGISPDVRLPIMMDQQVRPAGGGRRPIFDERGTMWLGVMARLKPGISIEPARLSADTLFQVIREPDVRAMKGDTPDVRMFKSLRIHLVSARTGFSSLSRQFAQPLLVLMCLVGVVLLIACLNVANLLLARATSRQKEIAVRLALGAGRFRLVRQLLTEGLLLSALGGVLGLVFARLGTQVLLGFLPKGRTPTVLEIAPDLRMLGFTLAVTLLTGLLFSLAPALRATRLNLIPALKSEAMTVSDGTHRWEPGRLLVILQVALSLVLLVGAGLFARSLRNLRAVDLGYTTDQVLTLSLDPVQNGYKIDQLRSFYKQLSERVAALPGVRTATFTRNVPISGSHSRIGIEVPGYQPRPDEAMAVLLNQIDAQFFPTFGTPLLMGREFTRDDTPESPKVVIINNSLARYFFGKTDPLGKRITLENYKDLEVVGVVADAKYRSLKEPVPQTAYIPYSQYDTLGQRTLSVRAEGNAEALIGAIRHEVRNLDANLPVFNIKTFAEQINDSVSRERLVALLSTFFGLFALLLASLGLYGVMTYGVTRRTRELGIRMALGAGAGAVMWMVVRETALLVIIGIVIGLPVALAATRMTEGLLFGLTPNDPLTIAISILVMLAIGAIAGYLPARRAAQVDPMVALRCE